MFAGKLPPQSKVFKSSKHVRTAFLSGNDTSDAEFAGGVAFAIENDGDNYPFIVAAGVVTFNLEGQPQAASVENVPKKVPQSTKQHSKKMKR